MATKEKAVEVVEETPKPKAEPQKYTIEALRQHCNEALGIGSGTFDGVFFNVKKKLTLTEAQAMVKVFMSRKAGGRK